MRAIDRPNLPIPSSLTRRVLLQAGMAFPLSTVPGTAFGQIDQFPSKEVRAVVGFGPGTGADIWVRFFVEQARDLVGRPVLVENKPGANAVLATEYVARSKPDGYTMLFQSPTSLATNAFMFKNQPADIKTSLRAIATFLKFSFYLVVDVNTPFKSVADVVAHARSKGTQSTFATGSAPGRLMGNLFKQIMKLESVEVQFKTVQDALNDLHSGAIDFMFADGVLARNQAAAGRLRILAVGSKERMKSDPDTPTMQEEGVSGLEVPGIFGVLVPSATPKPVVDKINSWFVGIMDRPATLDFIKRSAADPYATTPEEAQAAFIKSFDDFERLVKLAKIEPSG